MAQIPSTSVSMDTIKQTLTDYGGSVSNDLLSFFTSGANINKWSKWKPIPYPADFVDSEDSMKAYNWGMSFPSTYDLTTAYNGSTEAQWTYSLPSGGANAPYRLGDFRNYRPDATSPFFEILLDKTSAVAGDTVTATLYCRMYNADNQAGMLGLNDMGTLSGCQCCFIKKNPNGSLSTVLSSSTIADNHGSISATFPAFSTSSAELGTHYIMAALYKNGVYYPLPISKKAVVVESLRLYTTADMGAVSIGSTTIDGTAYFTWGTQESAASIYLNCIFELADSNGYVQQTLSATASQTVSRGEQKAFSLNWPTTSLYDYVITLAQRGELTCRASFNNGTYVTSYVNVNY